jgi:hypothetical protein
MRITNSGIWHENGHVDVSNVWNYSSSIPVFLCGDVRKHSYTSRTEHILKGSDYGVYNRITWLPDFDHRPEF